MMPYPQPYPSGQAQQLGQVTRRRMTLEEMQLPGRYYKGLQSGLRGLSLFCLILFVFSIYVLPVMVSDPITYDTLSMVLMVFMVVFGLAAIGMSVNTVVVRKKVGQAMAEGTAVEIIGPAYRAGAMRKGQGWTVGPISILPSRGIDGLLVEGMPTRVLCLPRLKAALAINNVGLHKGARIMCPSNLEAMAVMVGMPASPGLGSAPGTSYPSYGSSTPQAMPSQANIDEDLPLPPPPID